jgi:hypothetical protein
LGPDASTSLTWQGIGDGDVKDEVKDEVEARATRAGGMYGSTRGAFPISPWLSHN